MLMSEQVSQKKVDMLQFKCHSPDASTRKQLTARILKAF